MAPARPFTFLASAGEIVDRATLVDRARRAEDAGYAGFVLPDHLVPQLAPLPALAVVAEATQRLRIGTFVLNNDLRHPAVLAHDLATLDLLSGGRLDVGMGAGWNRPEYAAAGIPFDAGAVRVDRLTEAIAILKGSFGDAPFSFEGTHYTITDLDGQPKPVQRPHPPFFVGGGGRRILSLAGREAQVVGLAPRLRDEATDVASCLAAATAEKLAWVADAAGDRLDEMTINTYPALSRAVVVTDRVRDELAALRSRLRDRSVEAVSDDELLASPHVFIGSEDSIADHIRVLRDRFAISSFTFDPSPETDRIVGRLAGT